jgi:hypothetical protein
MADCSAVFTIHATRKLLDRVKEPVREPVAEPSTALGNWYATAMFWRPRQVVLLVSERTLMPVLMPLAPASSLMTRFPGCLAEVLERLEVPQGFVAHEIAAMSEGCYAKTASRSVLGSLAALASLADYQRWLIAADDLAENSALLARTPCSPLYERHVSPDREVRVLAQDWAHGSGAGCSR